MFTKIIEPRFGDTDLLGHINNTVLPVWFEVARNPLFRLFDPELKLTPETFHLIMAHTDFDFVGELFFQKEVEIHTWISHIGNKSFTVSQEAWQDGKLCVKGNAVIVYYDFESKTTIPIPDEVRKKLSAPEWKN